MHHIGTRFATCESRRIQLYEAGLTRLIADAQSLIAGDARDDIPRSRVKDGAATCVGYEYGICTDTDGEWVGGLLCKLEQIEDPSIPFHTCLSCGSVLESHGISTEAVSVAG